MRPAGASERIKWPDIAIHAEHTVRCNDSCSFRMCGQCRFGGECIRVRVSFEERTRQKSTVYQRCMAQPVQQNCFAAPGQRGDYREIRHVTRGKQQRPFASRERGQVFLQESVFSTVTCNQM